MAKDLRSILRAKGVVAAADLSRELGVSRATLARLVAKHANEVLRIGQTRATRYALKEGLPGIDEEIPYYRVDEAGTLLPQGRVILLHGNHYCAAPGDQLFSGLPPELADMVPQGFLGRAFAQAYARDLGIPARPQDWSNGHILVLEARRGEDLPGNLILGQESAQRWAEKNAGSAIVETRRSRFPELARRALQGQPAGSSAGGEQPKFTAFVEGEHVIVKFAGASKDPFDQRWRDLLRSEKIALDTLERHGLSVARASIHEIEGMVFLEVGRFDRVAARGRRPLLTLAAIDDFLYGSRGSWAETARKLLRDGRLSEADARRVVLLDAFGMLIGDSDRHFHNLAFFPKRESARDLEVGRLELAPAFDKLPMLFAPVAGKLVDRSLPSAVPSAHFLSFEGVWEEAQGLATAFWDQVIEEPKISMGFKRLLKTD